MSMESAAMTIIVGRRRTGKTTLINKAFEDKKYLYFFVGNATEQILCEDWQTKAEDALGIQIHGQITRIKDLLEIIFREVAGEQPRTTEVGHWWDSKGENEIDLIALEALDKKAVIAEVKRNPRKYSESILREKAQYILPQLKGYEVEYKGYSLDDM